MSSPELFQKIILAAFPSKLKGVMASIHNFSTILVDPLPIDSCTEIESKVEEGSLSRPRPRLLAWAEHLWHFVCIGYAYWTFVADIPLDLLWRNVCTAPGSATKDVRSPMEEQGEDEDKRARPAGRLALHPKFPLLAISTRSSVEIRLYHTISSQQICRVEAITPKVDPYNRSSKGPVITCLQFSCGNVLAVGLSDGTVRIVQQNMWALVKSTPDLSSTRYQPEVQEVNFLPGQISDISARFLGPVTNLVFSPTSRLELSVSAWLAVATEQSGVWLWSQRTKQTFRAFRTGGVNQGNLHWVRLAREVETEPEPSKRPATATPPEKVPLGQSTVQRYENVLGNAQDILKLNEYFTPASMKHLSAVVPSLSHLPHRPPLADVADTGGFDGQTLLVVGLKNGQVRVQKLWHSSIMFHMETYVDFPLRHLANPRPKVSSKFTTAGVEISHLVIRPISLARNTVIVPILVAFTRETSSKLHEVFVHLPFKQRAPPMPWSRYAYECAKNIIRYFVNISFAIMLIDYEWLPDIFAPPIDDSVLAIIYCGANSVRLSPSSCSRASLISLSITHHPAAKGALLATLRPAISAPIGKSQSNSCILLSSSDPEVSPLAINQLASIIPQIPNPFLPTPFPVPPKPLPRGYYSRMLAVLDQPHGHHQIPYARSESSVEHDYACGEARWGMSRNGRVLGAFMYQPASLLDSGVGVALFEMSLGTERWETRK